jgi:ferredoxin
LDRLHRALRLLGLPVGDGPQRFAVVVEPEGWVFEAEAGVSLVESARRGGVVLPTSCRNGTCRTCRCQIVSGRARHLIEWPGLSEEEKLEGSILPCVATPESALRIQVPMAFALPGATPAQVEPLASGRGDAGGAS